MTPTPQEFASQHPLLIAGVEDEEKPDGRYITFYGLEAGVNYGIRIPHDQRPDDPVRTIYDPALIYLKQNTERANLTRRFRKKPVVIEAAQLRSIQDYPSTTEGLNAAILMAQWCGGRPHMMDPNNPRVIISTLEGDMEAKPGDWIIRGVKGEFYPCKPDIFAATYDPEP